MTSWLFGIGLFAAVLGAVMLIDLAMTADDARADVAFRNARTVMLGGTALVIFAFLAGEAR